MSREENWKAQNIFFADFFFFFFPQWEQDSYIDIWEI